MNLFKESFLYAIGYLFSRFQYFFILPFLLKKISTADYGIIESLSVLQLFILVLVVNNFDTSLSSYYYEEAEKQKSLEVTGLYSCLLNSLLVMGVFFIFIKFFSKLILSSEIFTQELLIAVAWSVLNALIHYNSFLLRLQKKIKQYSFLLIFQGMVTLFLIYFFTVVNPFGVKGYLYGNLAGAFVALIITQSFVSYNYGKVEFKNFYSKLFNLAVPMFPVSIAAWSLTIIDRLLLTKLSPGSLNDVGIYGFAVKMATLGSVLWGPFQLAWMPFALSSYKNENAVEKLETVTSWFFYLSFIVIIIITLFSPFVIHFLFPLQYQSAIIYVGPLMICSFFNIAYYLPYTSLIQMKKLYPVTLAFLSGAILNLILNILLIPKLGIVGAIIANVVGYFAIFGVTLFYSWELNFPKYFKKEYLLGLLFVALAIFYSVSIGIESYSLRIIAAFISCVLVTAVFYFFKLIDLKTLPRMIRDIF